MESAGINLETILIKAVETSDVRRVDALLQLMQRDDIILDINTVNSENKTPLVLAIISQQTEIASLLLEYGAKTDDALMYAIEVCSENMVTLICSHLTAVSKVSLQEAVDIISTNSDFKPVSNPLMFASRQNYHAIVQILIRFGATIPDLQLILEHSNGDTYEQYLACLGWHRSMSSEAYLLHSSSDPLEAAINAGKAIQKAKSLQQYHLRAEFDTLLEHLDQFVTKFVGISNSEDEIRHLLWNDADSCDTKAKIGVLPQRLHNCLDLKCKQFISSTACQHFVLGQWYMKWKELCLPSFILWTILVIIFQPVLCLAYMILPFQFHREIMKTPYVRFVVHWVSRIYFICFILYMTLLASDASGLGDDIHAVYNQVMLHFADFPNAIFFITYIWILGMTWRELCELFTGGLKSYCSDVFNYSDVLQLVLYWLALIFQMTSYFQRRIERKEFCSYVKAYQEALTNEIVSDTHGETLSKYTTCDQMDLSDITGEIFGTDEFYYSGSIDSISSDDLESITEVVYPFDANDPRLIGEALFAVATVLSFLALLRDFVILAFVGPLRASFGGMISDIIRFLILFIFVWISFALGMTQLYTTYDMINLVNCRTNASECQSSAFITFSKSLSALFWSLFNPLDKDTMNIDPEFKTTYAVGEFLYAIYMVVVVVVMLNALIAMMSSTYTKVEENSEVEWKVARTSLMAEYMTTTAPLPPPFNLFPTVRRILNVLAAAFNRTFACCHRDYQQSVEKPSVMLELQQKTSYMTLIQNLVKRFIRTYDDCYNADEIKPFKIPVSGKFSDDIAEIKESQRLMEKNIEILTRHFADKSVTPR